MKFDAAWLLDLLDDAAGPDETADALTACGFLVELREPGDGAEIWDVEVTTNRPDAMNHRGLAREAAVATGAVLKPLTFELDETGESIDDVVTVDIADPAVCTRFCARLIRGVGRASSPDWMQRRLVNAGVRPISAIVDVTNYVLLELGQPLHAYDLAKVGGAKLVARRALAGETLMTLDGETRKLDAEMPVIADAFDVVGLAGIMGGADSEIGDDTVDVLLEAAHFDPLIVRRAARALGMHTEASHRFERGADPEMPPVAIDYAAALIAELTGGTVCEGRIDVRPRAHEPRRLRTTSTEVSTFIGLDVPIERMHTITDGLELAPEVDGDSLTVTIPSFRVDLEREADLIEEIVRHIGFAAVPARLPVLATAPGRRSQNWRLIDRARAAAVGAGLIEVITWSFIGPDANAMGAELALCPGDPVELDNPLAITQSTMRRSLLPGLLSAVRDNLNQGERDITMFEQGRVYWLAPEGPAEGERLAIALAGAVIGRDEAIGFADLKGIVQRLVDELHFPPLTWRRGGAPWFDPSQGAILVAPDGSILGTAGLVADQMADELNLTSPVFAAELDLAAAATEPPLPQFEALPRFPAVTADMTVEHPITLDYADLDGAVRDLADRTVETVELRARYAGKGLPDGTVRTTLRLTYRAPDRSLTQDEVNEQQGALRDNLARRLGVTFA